MADIDSEKRGWPHYETALVWDAHSCLPLVPNLDLSALQRYRQAGATFVHINVGMDYNPLSQIIRVLAGYRSWLAQHSDDFLLVESAQDVRRAKQERKLGVAFDLEGSVMLDGDTKMLGLFRDLGVRQMHLAYNRNNAVAGGCFDPDQGLTALGREIVAEINRVGILMDCSHMGERSSLDVMELSRRPVVFSHSNVRALAEHPRNLTDAQIDACARTDGVIGICGVGAYLGDNDTSSEALLRHVEYVGERVGLRHVGIGLDYVFDANHNDMPPEESNDYWYPEPSGFKLSELRFKPPEDLPEIAETLARHSYADDDIRGVLGENFLRAAEQSWR